MPILRAILDWLFKRKTKSTAAPRQSLAWGARVDAAFRAKVFNIASQLKADPNHIMAVIAFETGYTFDPAKKNAAGSGATGLIQFMPKTAVAMGTTTDELAKMSAVKQLDYVYKYFKPYMGRLYTLSDVYMAVLWPKAMGKSEDYVLWSGKQSLTYRLNIGLDRDKDGKVTKAEVAELVHRSLQQGLADNNVW